MAVIFEYPTSTITKANYFATIFWKIRLLFLVLLSYFISHFMLFHYDAIFVGFIRIIAPSLSDSIPGPSIELLVLLSFAIFFAEVDLDEYRTHFRGPAAFEGGFHRLTNEDIFENENRQTILSAIIQEPGIHYSELKRKCGLQHGQLQWHIKILDQYGIIEKRRQGRYVIFTLTVHSALQSSLPHTLFKSQMTCEIFAMVEGRPGICSNEIAVDLDIPRNKVKYHTDKLLNAGLIAAKPSGRKLRLYVVNPPIL